ncbi:MAG: hypothetical protein LBP75_11220 [Planctomycetota bacterium]|nr:hypothetical protein [Planctomycetota bacterium]
MKPLYLRQIQALHILYSRRGSISPEAMLVVGVIMEVLITFCAFYIFNWHINDWQ